MDARHQWPKEGLSRIPYWVYTAPEIYAREQERIFCGRSWAYVALEAEIPAAGDFKRTAIGDISVVVVRDESGDIYVVENRCAHRGVQFGQTHLGHATEFMCPYHQWTYTMQGDLIGVPFRRGLKRQGGMPADFDLHQHGLRKLRVETRHGVVFASFADEVEPLEEYLGVEILKLFIIPRENFERGMPIATLHCESKGYLKDRVVAIRQTLVYAPRYMRRLVSNIRILGWKDDRLEVRANYAAFETLRDELTRVFSVGRCHDTLLDVGGSLKFKERLVVFDSELIPNSLIYPL